ncbi:MAG TPA: hypothetical protein VH157_07000 [Bryobacteraceae bacterium]|jgi:hypothetical protein|nr:hypothetical protein [Bryobacteraceae bacterium]
MAQVKGPYGLRIVKLLGDLPFSAGMHTYRLTSNQTQGFFFGDPVGLVGGSPVPIAATPTTAAGPNSPIGIMMGAEWQDPIRGFVNAQYFPANGIGSGATNVKLKIMDYPWLVMQVQADGPVTLASIGMNAALIGPFAAGNIATGDSIVGIQASSIAATATLAVRIYDFVYTASPSPGASSQPGDPFTDVLVVWNWGVQRFMQNLGQ